MQKSTNPETISEFSLPIVEVPKENSIKSFSSWYDKNELMIEEKLNTFGCVLLRGTGIDSINDHKLLIGAMVKEPHKYLDGNAPRTRHADNVYNASEYDPDAKIHLHTEFSYSDEWPSRLFFCCLKPADRGGETIVGDTREILGKLDPAIVAEFREKKIRYVRNLHSGTGGLGPSWQDAFETDDKTELERYCSKHNIKSEWDKNDSVRVSQVRPAVRWHPVTNEEIWFNQVDQFVPSVYGKEIYETLLMLSGNQLDKMPMYATFGDGTEIHPEITDHIIRALEAAERRILLQRGEILLIDNMMWLHGRMPFAGERRILVSMK